MKPHVSDERYEELKLYCEDHELDSFWHAFKQDYKDFDAQREALLWVVKRLLEEDRIKLVNTRSHVPLEGSINEQIQRFRDAFPKDDAEMDNGLWFFSEDCPGGSAWQHMPKDE